MTSGSDAASETQKSGGKGLAVAALVFGIIAFFPGCCMAAFYGNYVLAILAIIFGAMSMKGPGSGMAKAGLTLGIVVIIIYIALNVLGFAAGDKLQEWAKQMQQEQGQQQMDGAGNNNDDNNGGNDNGNFDSGSNDGNVDG